MLLFNISNTILFWVWQVLEDPLILMIGGGSFVGKSSVSAIIAGWLHPNNVVCTDYVREAIRPYVNNNDRRVLDCPTFRACEAMDCGIQVGVIDGFLFQSRLLMPSIKGIVKRCLRLGERLIVEGIHLVPSLVLSEIKPSKKVFFCIIEADEALIESNMKASVTNVRRFVPLRDYVRYYDRIVKIYDHIHEDARSTGTRLFTNINLNDLAEQVVYSCCRERNTKRKL